jgi:antitoxin component of MazEF toxin-antitoxin module
MKTKIIRIGNSKGIIIPSHLLKKLGLDEGTPVYLESISKPPGILLRPPESEMEDLGVKTEDRKEIEEFLTVYQHILKGLK